MAFRNRGLEKGERFMGRRRGGVRASEKVYGQGKGRG